MVDELLYVNIKILFFYEKNEATLVMAIITLRNCYKITKGNEKVIGIWEKSKAIVLKID